ncbi:MAG: hypothetical protein K6T16_00730 [Candidatus Pacearchaeota archaeon]|nr:hypothetical protein [Candidatus Pacearchaeota archaeon]
MPEEIEQLVNNAVQFLQTMGPNFYEIVKIFYEAPGISQVLRQQYNVSFGAGYVAWLLYSIHHKQVMPGKEAEDAALVMKCLKEFGGE